MNGANKYTEGADGIKEVSGSIPLIFTKVSAPGNLFL